MVNNPVPVLTLENVTLDELDQAAENLLQAAGSHRIWLFLGDMGAGKTTLIKAIAGRLKVTDTVASPTYSIVNEYREETGGVCYHFDFYRIDDDSEAEDIGLFEYFDSGSYCFVEWPEKIERLLPDSFVTVRLEQAADGSRRIEMRVYE